MHQVTDPENHKFWRFLNSQQQQFVKEVIKTGDTTQAALASYICKNSYSATRIARRCLQNIRIYSTLIDCGFTPEASSLTRSASAALISRRLRNVTMDDTLFVKLMGLYVSVQGWAPNPYSPSNPSKAGRRGAKDANEEDVNELVMQLERKQKGTQ
jgi:hypothetical protein